MRQSIAALGLAALAAAASSPAAAAAASSSAEDAWKVITPHFAPPKEYENDFGPHKPLLKFYDGKDGG